jgi:signal transduction histidine kinase
MRERLAKEAAERTRMLAAVAHDLRTPLTGLRLRAESAPSPARERMVADIARMQAMITDVLEFARPSSTTPEPLQVREVLEELVAEAQANGTAVTLIGGPDALIEVDLAGFRRALENLINNAAEYAGAGRVGVDVHHGRVVITVSDRGPGIPRQHRTRLLRPFERGEDSRNRSTGGAGLGLSIVSDFADLHRGSFVLSEAVGGGTVAEISLPTASRPRSQVCNASAGDAVQPSIG